MTRQPKIMIGLPCYGGEHPLFTLSLNRLLAALQNHGWHVQIKKLIGDSLVPRARNKIAAQFMAGDADVLLQLDNDLEFDAQAMVAMLDRKLPIVGGLYFLKRADAAIPCANGIDGAERQEDGLQEVKFVGTGMLAIDREVFSTLVNKELVRQYQADDDEGSALPHWDFFPTGVFTDPINGRTRYLSEDWAFCLLAMQAGYKVYCDTRNMAVHYGEIGYPIQRLFKREEQP